MDVLQRKLIREFWSMRWQVLAIVLVIASGVAINVMSRCTLSSIEYARDTYYRDYQFADLFAHLKRAPLAVGRQIAGVPGIARVETRIVTEVRLDMPGITEPAMAKLISLTADTTINRLHLRAGRMLEFGVGGETIVSEGFAAYHGLSPGDAVTMIINGRRRTLKIVGVASSPEFIFQIRDGGLMPDDRLFGIFWVDNEELAANCGLEGAFNDVCCQMVAGTQLAAVTEKLDQLLDRYGGLGAIGRNDQSSHRFVENELKELRGMAVVVPAIFLAVTSFLLHLVVSRLITLQRQQIATLKAFGYSASAIGWHYSQLVGLFVVSGVAAGVLVGSLLGQQLVSLYTRFFRFAELRFDLDSWTIVQASGLTTIAALLGTGGALLRAVQLPPAEAMRANSPDIFRPSRMRILGLERALSETSLMMLRQLELRPLKGLLTSLGVALAVAVLILGNFMIDSVNAAMRTQYYDAMREDASVQLSEVSSWESIQSLSKYPGVIRCEAFRMVPVKLRNQGRERRVGLSGLVSDAELHRLLDIYGRPVEIPREGIVLSRKLAEVLGVDVGETLECEALDGKRLKVGVRVSGLIEDFSGLAAYMELSEMNRLLRDGSVVSGAFLAVDSLYLHVFYQSIRETPLIASVLVKEATMRSYQVTVSQNLLRMRAFIAAFAIVIAIGVIFNSARISLSERGRELATLRVMGFMHGEVVRIFIGELLLLTIIAVPLGCVIGYWLAVTVVQQASDTELFRMPLVVERSTYGYAALVIAIAFALTAFLLQSMIRRLNMLEVLKARE